jgi:hypothetical protein
MAEKRKRCLPGSALCSVPVTKFPRKLKEDFQAPLPGLALLPTVSFITGYIGKSR